MEQVSYDTIGTRSAPATLTAAYTGNTKTLSCKYLPDLQVEVRYTPLLGQTDRYALILVETSNDGGTTFTPVSAKQVTTTGLELYTEGDTSTDGIPVIIPGDKTSTGGVLYKGTINVQDLQGDFVKISVRESGAANFGTIFLGANLQSKK